MRYLLISFYLFLFGVRFTFAQNNNDIVIGKKINIHSTILNEERICLISLPDSYNDSSDVDKKYPILILLDGATFFTVTSRTVHFMSSERNRTLIEKEILLSQKLRPNDQILWEVEGNF